MGLFKKRTIEAASECPGGARNPGARVVVLGTGCKSCRALHENAVQAVGAESVDYVTDMSKIAAAGVMGLPALMIDGRVTSTRKVLSPEEIASLVRAARP